MSHIVPYIPTEPPSIHDDSFEQQSSSSEIGDFNFPKVLDVKENISAEEDYPTDIKIKEDYSDDEKIYPPLELCQHIDNVIEKNNLRLDCTDSGIKGDCDDAISECSFEGQFDAYIDHVNNIVSCDPDAMECDDTHDPTKIVDSAPYLINQYHKSPVLDERNVTAHIDEDDLDFDEFGEFNLATEAAVDYFTDRSGNFNQENQCPNFAFGDFDVTDSAQKNDLKESDDDFDDFATFNCESIDTIPTEQTYQIQNVHTNSEHTINHIVESFRQKLLTAIGSVGIDGTTSGDLSLLQSSNYISNNPFLNEYGSQIWKELTNFDYSPAFIFHWMQSTSYENFMNSMGPDYKELLSTQRATLPLYSVNMTPIEPVPADCFSQNIHSTASSSLDLTIPDKSTGTISEKNSSIDIKNLEDEFIFNATVKDDLPMSGMKSDNRASLPNLSSAVIQSSEGLGGIFKSILKPLNPGKCGGGSTKPVHPQTEAVLKELPDLSYMSSKVLMFPVLASCDVEDNI